MLRGEFAGISPAKVTAPSRPAPLRARVERGRGLRRQT